MTIERVDDRRGSGEMVTLRSGDKMTWTTELVWDTSDVSPYVPPPIYVERTDGTLVIYDGWRMDDGWVES